MAKKYKPSAAEIANDPSLKWHPYHWGEVVISDTHAHDVRFIRYENGLIRVAEVMSIREYPDLVAPLSIRRHTIELVESREDRKQRLAEIVAKKILARQ